MVYFIQLKYFENIYALNTSENVNNNNIFI